LDLGLGISGSYQVACGRPAQVMKRRPR
jgi:hypothetical protein